MREILFRANRVDNGEWVEGYYIYHIKRTICPFGDSVKPEDEQHVIMQDGFSDWNMPRDTVFFEIDPKTLCQYTGLKKFAEKDIVKRTDLHMIGEPSVGIIEYDIENTAFIIHWIDNQKDSPMYPWKDKIEVIGNIFDNPELLEGMR